MPRVHNAEAMGSAGGARALGSADIQPGFPGAPNVMNLTPAMLESLGPIMSQLMSVGGLNSFAGLQVIASFRNVAIYQHDRSQGRGLLSGGKSRRNGGYA